MAMAYGTGNFEDDADRSTQYMDTDPEKLRDQLNENWRQLRLFKAALQDRDEVINELHGSIRKRDQLISNQEKRIKLMNRLRPLIYAGIGSVVAKVADVLINLIVKGHL